MGGEATVSTHTDDWGLEVNTKPFIQVWVPDKGICNLTMLDLTMEMPATWNGYRSCPLPPHSKGQYCVRAPLVMWEGWGQLSTAGASFLHIRLCIILLTYLRAGTFGSQFSIIFNSTPKITKHREYNYWGLFGQSLFFKVFNRFFSIVIRRKRRNQACP